MVRTQVQLTERQASRLKAIAAEREISMAEVIRQALEAFAAAEATPSLEERRRRALEAVGRFASGRSDISRKHDQQLAEAYR